MITDKQLASWINHQRSKYKDGELSKEKIATLEAIPGWTWTARSDMWERGFRHAQKYGTNFAQKEKDPEGYRLGQWINVQRSQCKDPERRKRLESIPGWTWNTIEARFELAIEQAKKWGSRGKATRITPDGFRIGKWVNAQRTKCADLERRKRLEALPDWTWSERKDRTETFITEIVKYGKVPRGRYVTKGGLNLAQWVHNARMRKNRLTKEQRKVLESLPGWKWKYNSKDIGLFSALSRKAKKKV